MINVFISDKRKYRKVVPSKLTGNPAVDEITMMYWRQENGIKEQI